MHLALKLYHRCDQLLFKTNTLSIMLPTCILRLETESNATKNEERHEKADNKIFNLCCLFSFSTCKLNIVSNCRLENIHPALTMTMQSNIKEVEFCRMLPTYKCQITCSTNNTQTQIRFQTERGRDREKNNNFRCI